MNERQDPTKRDPAATCFGWVIIEHLRISDSKNRVAAVGRTALSEHIVCSPGIGAEPQQA